ncbi:uncharacterized protein TNCV_2223451 [Trichonephila clavipes]|nr:uncharacterized protein TNCV_2223451 [Trichonephila clavipes]
MIQIISFGSKLVHCLTGTSQYAIGLTSQYSINGFSTESQDKACFAWPPRSPNLGTCDLYLWRFNKNCVYVHPQPADLPDLKHIFETAVARTTSETLNNFWDELAYRLDVCRVTNGTHIEHL